MSSKQLLFLAGVSMLGGCPEVACDLMAVASVTIDLTDEAGEPIADAQLTFSAEDADLIDAPCDALDSGRYVCGYEVAGPIEITIRAEGFESVTELVDVQAGTCHVTTEALEVSLVAESVDCTTEAVPSVRVTVEDEAGAAIDGAAVSWSVEDAPFEDCNEFQGEYSCGYEVEGLITVVASAEGYESAEVEVEVGADICHVITEDVTLVLVEVTDG